MQELLKLQAEHTQKNSVVLAENTIATDNLKVDLKKLTEQNIKASNDEEFRQKRSFELSENLKSLNGTLREAIKNGLGAVTGARIASNTSDKALETSTGSGLRQFLLGGKSGDEIHSRTGSFVDKLLTKREGKIADAKEKKEFVDNAMKHDPTIYARRANFAGGMKTEEGRAIAKDEAEKRFEEIKALEAKVTQIHDKIESAKEAGYEPLKKDEKERDEATKELALKDTRMKSQFQEEEKEDPKKPRKVKENNVIPLFPQAVPHTIAEEDKAATAKYRTDQLESYKDMGKTLKDSLDIQKQQLEAISKMGSGGGESATGGPEVPTSVADTVMDAASNLPGGDGGKGKGSKGSFGKRAGNFLKSGGGRLLGVASVGLAGYEIYQGWKGANEEEAAQNQEIDAKVASGELSRKDANKMKAEVSDNTDIKKGEAVGGGVGGAGGALAGAAAGAAIGSVVPVVGTAIGGLVGGALGYYGGNKVGEKVGGALTSGYKSVKNFFGGGDEEKPADTPTKEEKTNTREMTLEELKTWRDKIVRRGPLTNNELSKEIYQDKLDTIDAAIAEREKGNKKPEVSATPSGTMSNGSAVYGESKKNADLATQPSGQSTSVVNAPTTINNNSGGTKTDIRSSPRNQESTQSKYIAARYG